jgi:hypothetical protein
MAPTLTTHNQSFTTHAAGDVQVMPMTSLLGYSKVCLAIVPAQSTPAVTGVLLTVTMGKLSQWTLAQQIDSFPFDNTGQIHTYDVIGPQMSTALAGGPPNAALNVQAWILLT